MNLEECSVTSDITHIIEGRHNKQWEQETLFEMVQSRHQQLWSIINLKNERSLIDLFIPQ